MILILYRWWLRFVGDDPDDDPCLSPDQFGC